MGERRSGVEHFPLSGIVDEMKNARREKKERKHDDEIRWIVYCNNWAKGDASRSWKTYNTHPLKNIKKMGIITWEKLKSLHIIIKFYDV